MSGAMSEAPLLPDNGASDRVATRALRLPRSEAHQLGVQLSHRGAARHKELSMQSYSRDRARRALAAIAVCIAAVGLTAMPAFAKSSGLTKKQVITLIKKYAKPGPAGPSGSKGSTGNTGPMGNPGPTYAAGTGLTLSGSTFSVAPTIFQQRVSTTCPGDESMYGIEQNGTPMCAVGTDADSNDNISADETIVSD